MTKRWSIFLMVVLSLSVLPAQDERIHHLGKVADSGGPIVPEQAAYDVTFYRLNITIDTTSRSIRGSVLVRATTLQAISIFLLDLHPNFTVDSVIWRKLSAQDERLPFTRPTNRISIAFPFPILSSTSLNIEVFYRGTPVIAVNPPWGDGFVWSRAPTGLPWAGVACEDEGGDIWWPCKDHPSDEPDSMALNFTVPSNLMCVSNGKLLNTLNPGNGWKTYQWYVSNPINNYCVTFYLGPLQKIDVSYTSVTGQPIQSEYWFLPHNVDTVKKITATWLKDLRFFEEICGPYPFRADKYCIVDAPYAGMEHQTSIAYGVYGNYHFNPNFAGYGFDYIHLHELAHEWWGNLVTAKDWSDLWIHEGFATYMEALFVERQNGYARYKSYMARLRPANITRPIAPNQSVTAADAYLGNVYNGGAWVIHTFRHYIGDTTFFKILRRWAYPDPSMESVTNGKQCRLATVEEFRQIAEQISGKKLDWFFTVYLRQAALPQLTVGRKDTNITLRWSVPNNISFPMPVDVQVGSNRFTVDMSTGTRTFSAPNGVSPVIDPDAKIFMLTPKVLSVDESEDLLPRSFDVSVYPNPFNPTTTLRLDVPEQMHIQADLFSVNGRLVQTLLSRNFMEGRHTVTMDLTGQSSGVYFLHVCGREKILTRKVMYLK
ncbi:MAG: M1 family aminopeptidase [bacterium]